MNAKIDISKLVQRAGARPHLTGLYGVPGIGKTTLTSFMPNPVYLMCEDGLATPRLQQMPYLAGGGRRVITSYDEMLGLLGALAEDSAGFKTVVIDTISSFEPLVHAKVLKNENNPKWRTIADIPYGRGPDAANLYWYDFMHACQALLHKQNVSVILLCHSITRNITPPDSEGYERFEPQLHKKSWPVIMGECDNFFFARRPVTTKTENTGFQNKARAIGISERRLYCEDSATHVAKNRCDMPEYINMDFAEFAKYVPFMAHEPSKETKTQSKVKENA